MKVLCQTLPSPTKNQAKQTVSPSKIKHTHSISTTITSETDTNNQYWASSFIDRIKHAFQNSQCMANNPGLILCTNPKCEHMAVVCNQINCVCKQKHKRCFTAQIDGFLEKYEAKVKEEQKFMKEIQNFFDKLIDQISQFSDNMIQNMKGVFISPQDISFLNMIQNGEFKNLKGKDLKKIFENLDIEEQIKQENAKMTQLLDQLKQIGNDSTQSFRQFEMRYKIWKSQRTEEESMPQFTFESLKIKKIDTEILSTNEEVVTLNSFFGKKPIKKLNLLYRASQNNFLTAEFYDKCSNIPNTLIVIKTEYDKIIGGFTPIPWKKYEDTSFQLIDPSKESFIFSVSEGDKFALELPEYATYYLDSSPGPRFGKNGYADLWICNKANTSNLSYVFGYMAYQNKNYDQTPDSYLKFLGGETEYFRTKQWEVFQVLFD